MSSLSAWSWNYEHMAMTWRTFPIAMALWKAYSSFSSCWSTSTQSIFNAAGKTWEKFSNQESNSSLFQGRSWFKPQYRASIRSLPWYGGGSSNNNKETISTAVCLYENLTREHILSRKLKVLPFHKWHRARCRYQKTPNHLLTFEMMRFDWNWKSDVLSSKLNHL